MCIFINYRINTTKYCTKPIFCGIDAITVLSYGLNFSSQYMILSRDNRFLSQTLSYGTATFILRIKVKASVFLVFWVSLTACNICQRAISQNIAQLHHIDLYGIIL